jgi:hypothetical protein
MRYTIRCGRAAPAQPLYSASFPTLPEAQAGLQNWKRRDDWVLPPDEAGSRKPKRVHQETKEERHG